MVEEKQKRDAKNAGSSKRATRSINKKEEGSPPQSTPKVVMEEAPKDKKHDQPRGPLYKLKYDIGLVTDLKKVFEEHILNSKMDMTLGDILGIAKCKFREEIIDIIKRKRQIPSDQELDAVKSQGIDVGPGSVDARSIEDVVGSSTGDGYEIFIGGKAEDVDKFIRRIELTALKSKRDDGAFKVRLVSLLLEGEAREWCEDRLEDEKKANWDDIALSQALKEEFGRVDNPVDLWREPSKLHQGEQEDINVYVNRFEACWRNIIKRLGENQMPLDFLKKDRFVALVHHGIKEKVELKDPATYNEAMRIAREQWRKKVQQGHNQAQVPPQFNVGILEAVHEVDEDDEVDVFENKWKRAQRLESEGHNKEERAREKLRRDEDKGKAPMEEGKSSKQAKARARRRKIGMDDFQLGKGQPAYDLLEDLKNKRADI
ncbi:hypothetical protein L7F22_030084 [Adiantum nelumboides]|nr:hypothetical protein [Adiantum nelumboides]